MMRRNTLLRKIAALLQKFELENDESVDCNIVFQDFDEYISAVNDNGKMDFKEIYGDEYER